MKSDFFGYGGGAFYQRTCFLLGLSSPILQISRQYAHEVRAFSYRRLESQLMCPRTSDPIAMTSIASGFVTTLALMFLRMRFMWWNLHPAGYAISSSRFSMNVCWFSIFVSWLLKYIILRSSGLRILTRVRFSSV